jgi:two-component system, chemotaxis family, protein-glutamate methylesterase/glutaminase
VALKSVNHDIVVIGASMGGLQALCATMRGLPARLPAAVFVVTHIGKFESQLANMLDLEGPLQVKQAEDGEPIRNGIVYVAAPDRHLLLHDAHLMLRRGPHENATRPAIDPLFRSAACTFGACVIGVVLSGGLNDGTAGLSAVKRCGGIAVIQDPDDAAVPSMPLSARRHVAVDYVAPAAELGRLIARLVETPSGPTPEIPADIRFEAVLAAQELRDMTHERQIGNLSPFRCPDCGGSLWEISDGSLLRYRCHIGHAYTADAMLEANAEEIDSLLARLLRSHKDRAELSRRMSDQARDAGNNEGAARLATRAREYGENAELIQKIVADMTKARVEL